MFRGTLSLAFYTLFAGFLVVVLALKPWPTQAQATEQGPVVVLSLPENKQLETFRAQHEVIELRLAVAQAQYQLSKELFKEETNAWLSEIAKTHKVDKVMIDAAGVVRVVTSKP